MGKIAGIALIATGAVILLTIIVMGIGGLKTMIGLTMPIGFKFMPLNQLLRAWVDVPLSMGLKAYLTGIEALHEEGYIAGGVLDFKITLSSGGPDDEEIVAVPVIFIQEDAEIDEIQRYVLRCEPLNYPSIIFWLFSLASLGGMLLATVVRIKMRGKGIGPAKESAVGPEPPPQAKVKEENGSLRMEKSKHRPLQPPMARPLKDKFIFTVRNGRVELPME